MHLYNLTLQRATGITHAVHGNFSGSKLPEIVVSRGKTLELLRPDPNTGKVHTLLATEVFGIVRSLMSFRLTGGTKDYVIVGSDSGRIVILEYNPGKNLFDRVHMETFGKSGCRRIVPGQYLAIDPKGRAVMIGERSQRPRSWYFDEAAQDADSDPTGEAAQKTQQTLTFYELDLGLNHVVRKYSEPLEEHANFLISVPGGNDGPSGVLVCSENYITYKNLGDQHDIRCPIPRRRNDLDDPERGLIFVCSATHKTKSMFFFLAQTEQGDIFKITVETDEDVVTEIKLKYFDTVPVAASMCVLKTGFLFIASEFGNHYLYQIANLGDDDDEPEFSSAMPLEEGDTFFFAPRPLRNLVLVDELESLSPILSCQIADLANEDTPQVYSLCGRGPRSSLRVLRHGLEVSEMAVSELPGNPNAVWTVRKRADDDYDAYIIVSFVNATLVLSIGETVEEVTDSGFLGTTPTLSCSQLGDDALVQIYPDGIRHIRADKRVNEWKAPGKKTIVKCAVNQRQVVIALTGGEVVYFEMDTTGQLNEYTDRRTMSSDVVCMALGSVPQGEQRSRFLAVGLTDNTVRIISLDPSALPAAPESLCVVEMGGTEGADGEPGLQGSLYLNIGLQNGVLLRTVLDQVTGDLSDTRTRYLGSRPVKLFRVRMQNNEAVLAMSSRSWLNYYYQSRFHLTPLSYQSLEFASGFASEQCPEGIVAISTNTLRILALEKLGAVFNQMSYPLEYTPRKFAIHQDSGHLVIIETDHKRLHRGDETGAQAADGRALTTPPVGPQEMKEAAGEEEAELADEMAQAFLSENLPETMFGAPKAGPGMWASVIRVMEPADGRTTHLTRLEQNEAALSIALVKFASQPETDQYVLVGVAKDYQLSPKQVDCGYIYCYKARRCRFVHRTEVEDVPTAICPYQGRALISVGKLLRIYDLGKKKMLRKCENKSIPNHIVSIQALGQRVYVADVQESVFFVRYKRQENQLILFADDTNHRWVTATCLLDYDTVAAADKFGNVAVLRLPTGTNDDVDEDPTGNKALWDRGLLGGASQKADVLCQFHIGETVLSLQRATLIPGGSESLVYTTISGTIGVLVPFTSHEDMDFFQHLEMHMRSENAPLCGRDHLSFRSYYFPVKNVLDGDMCEQYNTIDMAKQKSIAEDLDRTSSEVSKKLEDIRTRYAF
ncbi:splicing factor 3B subunit 3-like [Pollicipes pollicipes]|uniref:splicing factor 3B subunit 3-like n=1 Tax=Pollicipes pollicipes TaxID=41117 RepID=UPI00188524CB|nr:splicing factor 3B subunit 3-like [Pollicipes pollicipes]